jgi:hypothetical protein
MANYKATRDGFIVGKHYKKGDAVPLTANQAKYLSAPYGNDVVLDKPKPADKAK